MSGRDEARPAGWGITNEGARNEVLYYLKVRESTYFLVGRLTSEASEARGLGVKLDGDGECVVVGWMERHSIHLWMEGRRDSSRRHAEAPREGVGRWIDVAVAGGLTCTNRTVVY